MYCKHLKQKMNRTLFCKKKNKVIQLCECQTCNEKEFNKQNDKLYLKNKNTLKSAKNTISQRMKNKSKKQAKKERDRFSVFTTDLTKCIIDGCELPKDDLHEIFEGANRTNSMKYGFVIPICRKHHNEIQDGGILKTKWRLKCKKYFIQHYGTEEDFKKIFHAKM